MEAVDVLCDERVERSPTLELDGAGAPRGLARDRELDHRQPVLARRRVAVRLEGGAPGGDEHDAIEVEGLLGDPRGVQVPAVDRVEAAAEDPHPARGAASVCVAHATPRLRPPGAG